MDFCRSRSISTYGLEAALGFLQETAASVHVRRHVRRAILDAALGLLQEIETSVRVSRAG